MKKTENEQFVFDELLEEAAEQLKTLGHPLRLRILDFLRENGESKVGEIVRRIKAPQAVVSLHLNKMKRAGTVIARREAREVYYWIASEIAQVVADALNRKRDRALGRNTL